VKALVREVPSSFARALAAHPPDPPIDVARARAQHAAYVAALAELGATIVRLPADEDHPDCCFVEDTAVVAGGVALATRPGAPSRRGEVDAVAVALGDFVVVRRVQAPGTLDGGDVLRVGRTFFAGASARSNAAGLEALAAAFPYHRVEAVAVPAGVLHLKSVCSAAADDLVLVAEGTVDPARFGVPAIVVPAGEAHAANAVALPAGVLVAAGAPRTRALLEARGLRVLEVDTSEMRKADGALTCLSILVP
jgi:dimethylargininase